MKANVFVGALLLALAVCSGEPPPAKVAAVRVDGDYAILTEPDKAEFLKVATAERDQGVALRLPGRLVWNEELTARIHPQAAGRVGRDLRPRDDGPLRTTEEVIDEVHSGASLICVEHAADADVVGPRFHARHDGGQVADRHLHIEAQAIRQGTHQVDVGAGDLAVLGLVGKGLEARGGTHGQYAVRHH